MSILCVYISTRKPLYALVYSQHFSINIEKFLCTFEIYLSFASSTSFSFLHYIVYVYVYVFVYVYVNMCAYYFCYEN